MERCQRDRTVGAGAHLRTSPEPFRAREQHNDRQVPCDVRVASADVADLEQRNRDLETDRDTERHAADDARKLAADFWRQIESLQETVEKLESVTSSLGKDKR